MKNFLLIISILISLLSCFITGSSIYATIDSHQLHYLTALLINIPLSLFYIMVYSKYEELKEIAHADKNPD